MNKTLELIHYYNGTFEDEQALYDKTNDKLITKGDDYHDKIYEYIQGILHGFIYSNIKYNITSETVNPKDKMFDILEFYNEDYEEYEDECDEVDEDEEDDSSGYCDSCGIFVLEDGVLMYVEEYGGYLCPECKSDYFNNEE